MDMKLRILLTLAAGLSVACLGHSAAAQQPAAGIGQSATAQSAAGSAQSDAAQPLRLAQADAGTPASPFEAGTHYRVLSPAQSTSSSADQVEVAEIFMYSCPGCYGFEPYLEQWQANKPDYINFVRVPAAWNPLARLHAQAFYAAEALGKLDEMHAEFFTEIHVNRNALDSEAALAEFFSRFGVDQATFEDAFRGFTVDRKVLRADALVRAYRVSQTPTVVVNGKYMTNGTMAGSYETWFDVIEHLAALEDAGH
jgi:thiol:disulfide interchange protein DsbA